MTDEKQVVTYNITNAAIAKMEDLYMGLTVSGPDDEAGFKSVHKARKVVKTHRVSVEKRRKELKADALAWGRKVDGEANRIKDLLEPIETHLTAQEKIVTDEKKRIEEAEAKAFQEKIDERMNLFSGYNFPVKYQDVAIMADEEFDTAISLAKITWDDEQTRKAEEKRIEDENKALVAAEQKAEAERLEKIKAEQEKNAAELAAKQAEIDAKEAEIEAEKQKWQASQQALVQKAKDAERVELARLQAIADEKARVEREVKEAEEKKVAELAEKERVAALLPDKERAIKWIEAMRDSIPKRPAIKDNAIASMIVVSLDRIKSILDQMHKEIDEV